MSTPAAPPALSVSLTAAGIALSLPNPRDPCDWPTYYWTMAIRADQVREAITGLLEEDGMAEAGLRAAAEALREAGALPLPYETRSGSLVPRKPGACSTLTRSRSRAPGCGGLVLA